MSIHGAPKSRREAYEEGYDDGRATIHSTIRRGHFAELERAYRENDLSGHLTDALSALASSENTIYTQGVADDILDAYEEGFNDGFRDESEKRFSERHEPNPPKRVTFKVGDRVKFIHDFGSGDSKGVTGRVIKVGNVITVEADPQWAGMKIFGFRSQLAHIAERKNPLTTSERRRINKEAAAHDRDSAEHRTPYLKAFDKGTAAGMREAIAMSRANPVNPLGYSDGRRDRLAGRGARSANGNYLDGYYGIRRR